MPDVVELRIALLDIAPEIWRRTVVPASISLAGLHTVIQAAMGWENAHLHMFRIDDRRYDPPEQDEMDIGDDVLDTTRFTLRGLVETGDRFLYVYDFGDDWRHEVTVEAMRLLEAGEAVPAVVAGENACPPEDSGGPYTYPTMLEALRDPGHEDHAHYRAWIGDFDAETFDLTLADKRLRALALPSRSEH